MGLPWDAEAEFNGDLRDPGGVPTKRKLAGQRHLAGEKAGGELPQCTGTAAVDEQRGIRRERRERGNGCPLRCLVTQDRICNVYRRGEPRID